MEKVVFKLHSLSKRFNNVFFTSDEHYRHKKIIEYSNRPFSSIDEMEAALINNHNSVVTDKDITIHAGDFTFSKNLENVSNIITQLNGSHVFLRGSHDYWIDKSHLHFDQMVEVSYKGAHITACHYACTIWPRSHYGTWHVYGHSHGHFQNTGKSWDVGVDNNNYFPVSFDQLVTIMNGRPENLNQIHRNKVTNSQRN